MSKRIVLNTFGSLGDLHPYIAIAVELKRRGYRVAVSTSEVYRERVETENIEFYPVRPNLPEENTEEARLDIKQVMDLKTGTEYVLRQVMLPYLQDTYNDLMQAVDGANLLITHPLSFSGALLAQKIGIGWVSVVLSPISLFSAYDSSVLSTELGVISFNGLLPFINQLLFKLAKLTIHSWGEPIQQFRKQLGLPPAKDPFFTDQNSPDLVLALFSPVFAQPQIDWEKQICVTGFPFYDRKTEELYPYESRLGQCWNAASKQSRKLSNCSHRCHI